MLAAMDLRRRTGRGSGAREAEGADRGGAEHSRCDGGGSGARDADERPRRLAPVYRPGNDGVHAGEPGADHARVSDLAGIPEGRRHSAPGRAGRLLAGHDRRRRTSRSSTRPSRGRCGARPRRSDSASSCRERSTEVVGVVEDGKYHNLMESPAGRGIRAALARHGGGAWSWWCGRPWRRRRSRGAAPHTGPRPAERADHAADLARGARNVCCTRPGRLRSRWASWDSSR